MLSTTTHQNTASARLGNEQVNRVNNVTVSSNNHFNSQVVNFKQPPPPSKPPPPPPPPPRSNCYQSQIHVNASPSSSSTTSLHSFNNYSTMASTNSTSVVSNSIAGNGLTSNRYNILNTDNNMGVDGKSRYLSMKTRNTNHHLHGNANLSPRSSMSGSFLHYNVSAGVSPPICHCYNANIQPSKPNISSARFVHEELKSACNHSIDNHHSDPVKPYKQKCIMDRHSILQTTNLGNPLCTSTNNDHLGLSCSTNNIRSGRSGSTILLNDTARCQSMMNCTNPHLKQIFQTPTVSVCCCTSKAQNHMVSGNTASIGRILENNTIIGGSLKDGIDPNPYKQIHTNHKHNLSDSSCSTTTNTGHMQHNQHHHNLGCFNDIGSIGCSSDYYGLSSAASTSSANTNSLCSFNVTNELPPIYPLSKLNQPLPPLPSQPPPPPPPPPKGFSQQCLSEKNSSMPCTNLPNLASANKPINTLTKPLISSNSNNKTNITQNFKKSDIPPPLPPPNPGTKMASSGLISSNMSDSSCIKSASPAKSYAVLSTNSINNLLNYDVTQPKSKGPTDAELKLEALAKNYESEIEQQTKNGENLGICNYCGEKVKNAKDACRAMGQIFHVNCFVCCLCRRTLRGKTFYHVQDKVYCEEDYKYSGFQQSVERCAVCNHPIIDMILQAMGKSYHPACFKCCICGDCLDGVPFTIDMNNKIYCVKDYHRQFAPKCAACGEPITPIDGTDETVRVVSMDKDYHVDCYCCEVCGMQLTDDESKRCYPLEDHLLCQKCHLDKLSDRFMDITKLQ